MSFFFFFFKDLETQQQGLLVDIEKKREELASLLKVSWVKAVRWGSLRPTPLSVVLARH